MPTYRTPVKEMTFILNDVLDINQYAHLPGYEDATPDLITAILEEGAKFCENELAPLNLTGDQEGCARSEDGSVTTPKGFKEAYARFVDGGWAGLTDAQQYGGQGLPHVLGMAFEEMMISSNMAFAMYPGLSSGAKAAISIDGTDEQKEKYLPKMVTGEWTGTMNLTESHCGTDLGLLRTKAEPNDDGSFAITGQKIFISAGEHDMAENIIHLVLARTPGGPKGVKGISLYIVPKFLVNDDGSLGERNGVVCGSIEEKMGIHANSTCVLNYDAAKGYLLGDENQGLRTMFIMMNAARIGVGIQGLGLSEVSYQNAVDYAKDRLQMRSISGPKNPDGPADPIIVHPDVRRMLMNSRSFNESARTLALWCALLIDLSHKGESEKQREWAEDMVGLMTPVIKGVFTDRGYENASANQQVFGGHGYIAEWGMEQFVRDARITQIYEGTNGIQALDLVGRKLGANGGRAVQRFFKHVTEEIEAARGNDKISDFVAAMETANADLQRATMWLMQNAMTKPDNAGAGSTAYMHLFGHVVLGLMWMKVAKISAEKLDAGTDDPTFFESKLITGRYYINRRMPEIKFLLAELEAGADDVMALEAENF